MMMKRDVIPAKQFCMNFSTRSRTISWSLSGLSGCLRSIDNKFSPVCGWGLQPCSKTSAYQPLVNLYTLPFERWRVAHWSLMKQRFMAVGTGPILVCWSQQMIKEMLFGNRRLGAQVSSTAPRCFPDPRCSRLRNLWRTLPQRGSWPESRSWNRQGLNQNCLGLVSMHSSDDVPLHAQVHIVKLTKACSSNI